MDVYILYRDIRTYGQREELYKQARDGKIANFTGISDPYEAPTDPEIHLRTDQLTVDAAAKQIVNSMAERGLFST